MSTNTILWTIGILAVIAFVVGNILFMHGGISPYINAMDISINKLNEISRPWYPDSTYKYKDDRLEIIFGD